MDIGDALIDGSQSLFSHQVWGQPKLLSVFMPLLEPIIVLPNEVSADFMIEHSLHRVLSVLNWQTNDNPTHPIAIVMDHTGRGDRVLNELIAQQISRIEVFDVLIKSSLNFLPGQKGRLFELVNDICLQRFLKNGEC